jgi:hypothetical protein
MPQGMRRDLLDLRKLAQYRSGAGKTSKTEQGAEHCFRPLWKDVCTLCKGWYYRPGRNGTARPLVAAEPPPAEKCEQAARLARHFRPTRLSTMVQVWVSKVGKVMANHLS